MDGEDYEWTRYSVGEYRDGLVASVRQFDVDVDDEDAAFAYANTLVASRSRRLAIANRASEGAAASWLTMRAGDVETLADSYADQFVYDDRRRLSGDPITDRAGMRAAFERVLEQYTVFEGDALAVRGERLALIRTRWSDDAGNETTGLFCFEADEDGRTIYAGRFDEDDFDGAYRELEQRYYAAEGAAFAPNGHVLTDWIAAMDRLDVEAARSLAQPEFRWLALPTALLISHDHSVDELFQWLQERGRQVASVRNRITAIRWLSPNCCVGVGDARAVGLDGEDYEWMRLYVAEFRDGLIASVRQFELDDEEAAFAYAETLVTPPPRRLAVSNRASEIGDASLLAMQSHDIDAVAAIFADQFVYDDRRRLTGDPIAGLAQLRTATERILEQYSVFEARTLAVRGDRVSLARTRWSDNAENETTHLNVIELDDDGRIEYHGRFDGDDFGGAYRELEDRYYAAEGKAFAVNGQPIRDFVEAIDRLDVEAARRLSLPEFRWLAPPSTLTLEERSVDDAFRWLAERAHQVSSVENFYSVVRWLSPTCMIGRGETRAFGQDGEEYEWSRIYVDEVRDGRLASVCQFDDDEDAAFAYAETLVTPQPSLLAKVNKASQVLERAVKAMQANDAHTTTGFYADPFTYDDRRRINGDPIDDLTGLLAAAERILAQYNRFDNRTLAVRGDCLQLSWSRWADDAGNETTNLRLIEVDDDGRIVYEGRFDEDDFEGAYRELERRYYAGEGSAYAESGVRRRPNT